MTAAQWIQGGTGDPGDQRRLPSGDESAPDVAAVRDRQPRPLTATHRGGPTPSIADFYDDLLQPLTDRQRKGIVARLAVGYYEGWRPTRREMAQLVAAELRRAHPRR